MDLLRLRSLPYLSRRNYFYEWRHLLMWSSLAGVVEGRFASIVVAKAFSGSPTLVVVAAATLPAAFLVSLFWGMLCVGRPKVRLLTYLVSSTSLLVGTLGAIPATKQGAVWFVCQMAAAQVLLAGVVTVRSAVWKSNYPHSDRGRIIGRLQATRFVISIVTVLVAAWLCDHNPTAYRYIFPTSALLGLLSVTVLHRLHIRGERRELRAIIGVSELNHHSPRRVEALSLSTLLSPGVLLGRMVQVLRRDRRFAKYCFAQSFMGLANLTTIPVAVVVVARDLDFGIQWAFWISTGLIDAIPQLMRLGSIGRWARFFDRVGVVQFRVYNTICWCVAMVAGAAGTWIAFHWETIGSIYLPLAVVLFALRGMASGVGLGGGALAWNLGHLHFARGEEAEIYMGIHVFLTGLRGLVALVLATWLFTLLGWWIWIIVWP